MLTTEEEAKGKWCPQCSFQQQQYIDGSWCQIEQEVYCLGSECMAWRWKDHLYKFNEDDKKERCETCKGYCGLAGKVE